MKERGMIFNNEMVRAILDGRKTVTRRPDGLNKINQYSREWNFCGQFSRDPFNNWKPLNPDRYAFERDSREAELIKCPFGKIGDRIYVRETFTKFVSEHVVDGKLYAYKADQKPGDSESEEIRKEYISIGYPYQWKPSIHMPKSAARIWLEITNVRVERLVDITEEQALMEGIGKKSFDHFKNYSGNNDCGTARGSFISLWDSVYKNCSKNPWVWVIEFKRIYQ